MNRLAAMTETVIGVYGSSDDLIRILREKCPALSFAGEGIARDTARVVVVEAGAATLPPVPRKNVIRVIVGEGAIGPRRPGDLRVTREAFLAQPAETLAFAGDAAELSLRAAHLETQLGYLTQIHELMAMADAEAVSARITSTVLGILGLRHGTLYLHDPRLERYVVSFTNAGEIRDSPDYLPGIPEDLLQRALGSGGSYAVDPNLPDGGMIVMPLKVDQDLVGVIKVPLAEGDEFDEHALSNLTQYLSAVAQVLGNLYQLTRSRDLAMRDDLTKAFNRRFFDSYLDEEIERSRRYGAVFSIIFLDLDDLKMVNNFYGHLTGSRTLQEVAKRILAAVRGIDKVVRFGGDEFCIILPQTDQDQAVAVANRVRKAITRNAFHIDPNLEISITASFGIASYPIHAVTKDNLIRQADAAMFRVKSTTKNAVGVALVEDAAHPVAPRYLEP
ncbi:MAG TPA: GGDEF domain-containing protein [Thermoanaerobaculia bacterium]|nr:GGDEF domain-containing protein [Thermoanaerobaculia bacterium]